MGRELTGRRPPSARPPGRGPGCAQPLARPDPLQRPQSRRSPGRRAPYGRPPGLSSLPGRHREPGRARAGRGHPGRSAGGGAVRACTSGGPARVRGGDRGQDALQTLRCPCSTGPSCRPSTSRRTLVARGGRQTPAARAFALTTSQPGLVPQGGSHLNSRGVRAGMERTEALEGVPRTCQATEGLGPSRGLTHFQTLPSQSRVCFDCSWPRTGARGGWGSGTYSRSFPSVWTPRNNGNRGDAASTPSRRRPGGRLRPAGERRGAGSADATAVPSSPPQPRTWVAALRLQTPHKLPRQLWPRSPGRAGGRNPDAGPAMPAQSVPWGPLKTSSAPHPPRRPFPGPAAAARRVPAYLPLSVQRGAPGPGTRGRRRS